MADLTTTPLFGVPMDGGPTPLGGSGGGVATPSQGKKHGTVDGILGFLGDFLTSRLRMGTPYRDARQAEKLNEARITDMQDPSQTYANTGNIDPALAARLASQATDDKRLEMSAANVAETRAARIAQEREKVRTGVLDRAAGYFNNLSSNPKDIKSRYAAGRQIWTNSATVKNDPELLQSLNELYPETYDPVMITSSIAARVPVATQWAQQLTRERAEDTKELGTKRIETAVRGQDIRVAEGSRNRAAADARQARGIAARPAGGSGGGGTKPPRPTASDLQYLRKNPGMRDRFDGRFGVGVAKRVLGN